MRPQDHEVANLRWTPTLRRVSTRGDVRTVRCVGDGEIVRCVLNMGTETALVPNPGSVLLASTTHVKASPGTVALPPDSSVCLVED